LHEEKMECERARNKSPDESPRKGESARDAIGATPLVDDYRKNSNPFELRVGGAD